MYHPEVGEGVARDIVVGVVVVVIVVGVVALAEKANKARWKNAILFYVSY